MLTVNYVIDSRKTESSRAADLALQPVMQQAVSVVCVNPVTLHLSPVVPCMHPCCTYKQSQLVTF